MFDCDTLTAELAASNDPRLKGRYLRCLPTAPGHGPVLLVGVTHDHPASIGRVTAVLETAVPEFLALELPPLAVPLFRLYATDGRQPPRLGGEMSAALQTTSARSVGIDGPSWTYARRLLARVRREGSSWSVTRQVVRDFGASLAHAVASRVAAVLGRLTPLRPRMYTPITYDSSLLDPPATQAEHEAAHLSRRQAFVSAITPPLATQLVDAAREEAMSLLLHRHRQAGSVVAVIGMEHLNPLANQLRALADGP